MDVTCANCGKKTPENSSFCQNCGKTQTGKPGPAADSVTIGSGKANGIVMNSPVVSERHAKVKYQGGRFSISDLQSTNGIFINGERVSEGDFSFRDQVHVANLPFPWDHPQILSLVSGRIPALVSEPHRLTIGRNPDSHVRVNNPTVSWDHAVIDASGGRLFVEDLGSANGTYLDDERIPPKTRVPLSLRRNLRLGPVAVPWQTAAEKSGPISVLRLAGRAKVAAGPIPVSGREISVGRDPANDVVISDPSVSARHARIFRQGAGYLVEDLDSSNGTFVNGQKITEARPLNPSDTIVFGRVEAGLDLAETQWAEGGVTLDAVSLERRVRLSDKRIVKVLDSFSLSVAAGEIVAIMGPSGSGKTSLLTTLAGYTPPDSGEVLFNGVSLYRNYEAFKARIGYVPQEDLLHGDLTVRECFTAAARLKLGEASEADIRRLVENVIADMGLSAQADDIIGTARKRGLSGGQRKRVNIGLELLSSPGLLFLDEPTSSLSSKDARTVMSLLRKLADQGRTILLTIHQPGKKVLAMIDHLAIVDVGGKLAYYGPTRLAAQYFEKHLDALKVPLDESSENVADYVLEAIDATKKPNPEKPDFWRDRFGESAFFRQFIAERQNGPLEKAATPAGGGPRSGFLKQLLVLSRRYAFVKSRDIGGTGTALLQAPIVALVLCLLFLKATDIEVGMALFFLSTAALWFGTSNIVREVVCEWPIYLRERMAFIKILPYLFSKMFFMGLLSAVQCLTLLLIAGWGIHLKGSYPAFFGILFLTALVGSALGLVISCLVRTEMHAVVLLPLVLLPQILLGGGIEKIGDMIPKNTEKTSLEYMAGKAARVLADASPLRWSFEAMVLLEDGKRKNVSIPDPAHPPATHSSLASFHTFEKDGIARDVTVLGVFALVFTALAAFALKRRDPA